MQSSSSNSAGGGRSLGQKYAKQQQRYHAKQWHGIWSSNSTGSSNSMRTSGNSTGKEAEADSSSESSNMSSTLREAAAAGICCSNIRR